MIDDIHPAVLAVIAVGVILNLVVTFALLRDDGITAFQKAGQAVIVWLLPILGASIILAVIASHHSREEMKKLAPFPFYLAAYQHYKKNPNRDEYGGADYPAEDSIVEGSCGSD